MSTHTPHQRVQPRTKTENPELQKHAHIHTIKPSSTQQARQMAVNRLFRKQTLAYVLAVSKGIQVTEDLSRIL